MQQRMGLVLGWHAFCEQLLAAPNQVAAAVQDLEAALHVQPCNSSNSVRLDTLCCGLSSGCGAWQLLPVPAASTCAAFVKPSCYSQGGSQARMCVLAGAVQHATMLHGHAFAGAGCVVALRLVGTRLIWAARQECKCRSTAVHMAAG